MLALTPLKTIMTPELGGAVGVTEGDGDGLGEDVGAGSTITTK